MTSREIKLCNGIIHSASMAAAGVGGGMAQVPVSDNLVITPIQLMMAIPLEKVFGINLDQSSAKAALASAAAATVGRTASQVLVGWIPGIGNVINAVTAGTVTEGIGWMMAKEIMKAKRKCAPKSRGTIASGKRCDIGGLLPQWRLLYCRKTRRANKTII